MEILQGKEEKSQITPAVGAMRRRKTTWLIRKTIQVDQGPGKIFLFFRI